MAHHASHFKSIVSDSLHSRLHQLLLIWHLESSLWHAHGLWTLTHHLHLLVMHLHIHTLDLNHVADLAARVALALTVDA